MTPANAFSPSITPSFSLFFFYFLYIFLTHRSITLWFSCVFLISCFFGVRLFVYMCKLSYFHREHTPMYFYILLYIRSVTFPFILFFMTIHAFQLSLKSDVTWPKSYIFSFLSSSQHPQAFFYYKKYSKARAFYF